MSGEELRLDVLGTAPGSDVTLNGTIVDNYHTDNNNKLLWVNRGSMSPPTSQQASPYMLFGYDLNGNTTRRERRYDNGTLRLYDLFWDGDDNLRRTDQASNYGFVASYNGDGLRVTKIKTYPEEPHGQAGTGSEGKSGQSQNFPS